MNKLFSKIAALSVGLAMAIGVGVAVGSRKAEVVKAAEGDTLLTFSSAAVVGGTATSYTSYSDDNWDLNVGGNKVSAGWNKTAGNAKQVGSTFAIDSTSVTATTYGWVASTKAAVAKAGKLEFSYTGGSGNGSGLLWLGYSTDGTSYSKVELTSGTQGSSCGSTGTTYSFEFAAIDSAYYAIIVTGGASGSAFRFDSVTAVLKEGKTVDPSLKSMVIYSSGNPADGGTFLWSSTAGIYGFSAKEGESAVSGVTWSVSDTTVATINASTGYLTTVKPGNVTVYAEAEGYNKASAAIEITKSYLEELAVTGSMTKTTYTTAESWSAAGLVVTATYHSGWVEDVTSSVAWTYNPSAPAEGITSVVATATLDEESVSSSAQAVTVTVSHAGTAADPFTVAEALAKCAEIGAVGNKGQGPWVTTGIISRVTSAPVAEYWNATYYISDDGSQNNELQVYRGLYLGNVKFDADTALLMKAGMIVKVTGNLTGSYGSEYCQGNYLLSIEAPSSGDVDVVFEPETSMEIGDTGAFTATSEASGVVFSWEVEDSSILSVNASTGAYEALALGVTKVTVTATAGGKEGSASAYITVNGANYMTVNAANELAATVPTGQTTGYYVYVEGFVSAFDVDSKTRALNITSKGEDSTIMVFVGASGYSAFIDGLQVGMCLRVKANVQNYNGTYELTNPVKMYTEYVAMTFAKEFLDSTDAICEGYDGVSSNKAALEAIWSGFETKYDSLTTVQQNTLLNPDTYDVGSTVKDAMARYDYLTGKYELDNFVGRTPVVFAHINVGLNDVASDNNTMIIVVVIAAVSALAFATLLIFKKKKQK